MSRGARGGEELGSGYRVEVGSVGVGLLLFLRFFFCVGQKGRVGFEGDLGAGEGTGWKWRSVGYAIVYDIKCSIS